MDNTHLPPGGDEQANYPTEQFWPGQAAPGHSGPGGNHPGYGVPGHGGAGYGVPGHGGPGNAGPGYDGYHQQPGLSEHYARDGRRALHWSVGVALVALLAGGGAIAGVSLAGHNSPAPASAQPPAAAASSSPASPAAAAAPAAAAPAATGQAAVLNAALSSAGSAAAPAYLDSAGAVAVPAAAAAGTGGPADPAAAALAARCARARAAARAAGRPGLARGIRRACLHPALRALALRGVHGEFTFRTKSGFKTLAFERGTIESVSSGQDIVVRAPDGTTWTWVLTSGTAVRENGQQASASALATGEQIWAGGPVVSGVMDARLIVIRPPSGSAAASPPAS